MDDAAANAAEKPREKDSSLRRSSSLTTTNSSRMLLPSAPDASGSRAALVRATSALQAAEAVRHGQKSTRLQRTLLTTTQDGRGKLSALDTMSEQESYLA